MEQAAERPAHRPIKMLKSTKIAIGFAVVAAASFYGYRLVGGMMIDGYEPKPVQPTRVNLLGVTTGNKYQIVVQNQIAVLMESPDGGFEAPTDRDPDALDTGGQRRRVPIKEMLLSMQGDEKALGRFIMIMNDMKEADLPPMRVYWEVDDLRKALDGDADLLAKLKRDLGVGLDGRPLERLQLSSLENGIVIRKPVEVRVPVGGESKVLRGIVLQPYRSRFAFAVEASYAEKQVTREQVRGYVIEEARKLEENPSQLEDVRASLEARIDPATSRHLAAAPEALLRNAQIILNGNQMEDARLREYRDPDNRPLYDLVIDLTEEGRKRLWKYTRNRVGSQLLLVVDGVAIAAPRIEHELSMSEVTITQLQDGVLARSALEAIKEEK
ncbi:MAG TPA: hypothetical protein VM328_06975 [Fimbriimonadaceae bacterium]|nr:hypothetical protein [Fimbriimonadaceae bacterium]